MNYKKGFFRITLIISIASVIIGLFYGINKFSFYYNIYESDLNRYESDLELHKSYYSSMFNLLKEDIDNLKKDSLLFKAWELMERPQNTGLGRLPLRERVTPLIIYDEEKKFKVNRILINKKYLDSTIDDNYISVKKIIDEGINKKLDESIKNEISNEYANENVNVYANVSVLFLWKHAVIYLLLLPLLFGSLIWVIYYTVKFIVAGFKT